MMPRPKTYRAYTLIEMLVVMAIFVVISTIGMSAFSGLRDTISLNEDVTTLKQNIQVAQRSALFLDRKVDERWIYGIGIDMSEMTSTNKYRMFKWCAQFNEYGDERSKQVVPNDDPDLDLSFQNGNLPVSLAYVNTKCSLGRVDNELVIQNNQGDGEITENITVSIPEGNNATGDIGGVPRYILFEAVSGRAIFYDSSGNVINYAANGELVASPINFVIDLNTKKKNIIKHIEISNISGKTVVETEYN